MKKRTISVFAALLSVFLLLFGTSADSPEFIYWTEDYRLSWDDFKGNPAFYQRASISALTSSGIVHYKGCTDGKIIYKVRSYFEPYESWVKEEARTTHHLAHEQIHFDITELYARKLRKALQEKDFKCGEEFAFERMISKYIKEWQAEQQAYDHTSKHSLNKVAQKEWFYRIAMEISMLDDYK